ncbi:unnamed protein product [Chrysoparadoxa australica]
MRRGCLWPSSLAPFFSLLLTTCKFRSYFSTEELGPVVKGQMETIGGSRSKYEFVSSQKGKAVEKLVHTDKKHGTQHFETEVTMHRRHLPCSAPCCMRRIGDEERNCKFGDGSNALIQPMEKLTWFVSQRKDFERTPEGVNHLCHSQHEGHNTTGGGACPGHLWQKEGPLEGAADKIADMITSV